MGQWKSVFMKGANYIPNDIYKGKVDNEGCGMILLMVQSTE